jgi:hypothetical protein
MGFCGRRLSMDTLEAGGNSGGGVLGGVTGCCGRPRIEDFAKSGTL